MTAEGFQLPMPDGRALHVHRWLPPGPCRAVLLVAHGMAEHGARYGRFAAALNQVGWAVYALDWPGHGLSVRSPAELGHFADRGGWTYALDGLQRVRQAVEREQPGRPLLLLGHSMGSFLSQHYIIEHGAGLKGVVLSASSGSMGPMRVPGALLLRLEAMLLGKSHRSTLAAALSFGAFNKKFAPNRTPADWLSRDPAEVDKYVADPLCGFLCSATLWADLLSAGGSLLDLQRLARIPKELPVLLISGDHDAVSMGTKGLEQLVQAYKRAGLKDVELRLYEGARHEILNEVESCRNQVTADVMEWLRRRAAP